MNDTEKIPYWEYLPDYLADRDAYLQAVDAVFSSGRLILGPQVTSFEQRFATYCGATCAVGVNSGTDALFLALKGLGIGHGDEVITVSNTAVPTVAAIRATGATPVFVDVEEDTCLMDVSLVEARLNGRTRCILPVHLYGQMVDMEPLLDMARAAGIAVVEDCAQACGATYRGHGAGSMGDAGAFSFYPTKILGAFGDGGLITTSRTDLGERLRRLRFYGMEGEYYSEEEGYNSRLDEVQAALLNHRLPGVDAAVEKRRQLAGIYDAGLAAVGNLGLPAERAGRRHQYYLYTIRTAHRDALMLYLRARGVETKVNYPTPVHLMRGYAFLGGREGDLPVTERLAAEILSLPIYPAMPEENARRVVAEIGAFFDRHPSRITV